MHTFGGIDHCNANDVYVCEGTRKSDFIQKLGLQHILTSHPGPGKVHCNRGIVGFGKDQSKSLQFSSCIVRRRDGRPLREACSPIVEADHNNAVGRATEGQYTVN